MTILQEIKKRYSRLPLEEKKLIGEALLKVNLGVASPGDHRFVAGFLKGSGLVANKGKLDDLLGLLHEGEKTQKVIPQTEKTFTISQRIVESGSIVEGLKNFQEDSEVTEKMKPGK